MNFSRRGGFVFLLVVMFYGTLASTATDDSPGSLDSFTKKMLELYKTRGANAAAEYGQSARLSFAGPTEHLELWFDIYVKEGANAQSVRDAIEKNGGRIDAFIDWYKGGSFGALLPLSSVEAVAINEAIMSMTAVVKPKSTSSHLRDQNLRRILEKLNATLTQAATPTGTALNDQAFGPMGMQQARQQCPSGSRAGAGITVGILSNSFNNLGGYQSDVTRGYLPGPGNPFGLLNPVVVLQDLPANGIDEGRAMAQLVHAFVPYAQLCFATATITKTGFAANIISLSDAGGPCKADVLVDDIQYWDELYFEDDMLSQAVDIVSGAGKLYFSSAGNFQGHFYEADLNPVRFDDPIIPSVFQAQLPDIIWWHKFNILGSPSVFVLPIQPGATDAIYVQWNDQSGFVNIDLDMAFFDRGGVYLGRTSRHNNIPLDVALVDATVFYVAVGVHDTSPDVPLPRPYKLVIYDKDKMLPPASATERSIMGHPCANGAFAVAALNYMGLTFEPFSGHGPCTIYFGQRGPFSPPQIRLKPDIAGVDCTDTSFFGGNDLEPNGLPNFCGTSAAAPHAAGVGAYLQQLTNKRLTTASLRSIFANTSGNAMIWNPLTGYGLINALAAAKATASC
eukprot:CAMPEP_0184646776 /NCGR_PEP_ID=MMETSP0308-20130426/3562_1 /TAXON_ID=38269 /ORGANISM="Gloeochaete witrockiana, Strain SAG 46.84" /LENGTH=620 /DNA_ID=CAMNT_0027077139 /DNA_START=110 /DNA_END=1972 /DNA_ORIENTATION=+